MKNFKLILIVIISFFPFWLGAKQVSPETAKQVAATQVSSHGQLRSAQELNLVFTKTNATTTNSKTSGAIISKASGNASADVLYYVFNAGTSGFVIVSGDDVAKPVLGYSDAGAYDPNNLPPNFVYYLDDFLANEIKQAIAQGVTQSEETKKQWEAYLSGNVATLRAATAVEPLLGPNGQRDSIAWNQFEPYNDQCPVYSGTKTVTGCVATAMAQIMMYHQYPTNGSGTVGGYPTSTGFPVPATDISTHQYLWNTMLAQYTDGSYSGTPAEIAVATLMYDCGRSVNMDYNIADDINGGSGAQIIDAGVALRDNFSYNSNISYKQRTYCSNDEWIGILNSEINAGRPVLYGGQDQDPKNGGHAFVCDGYDDSGNFHFNWGWSGGSNGFYALSALNPVGTIYHFNNGQEMVYNIISNNNGQGAKSYDINIIPQTDISTSPTTLDRGQSFTVNAPVCNTGLYSFTGNIGIAIVDANDNIISVIGQVSVNNVLPGYGWYNDPFPISCAIPVSTAPGSCKIRVVYQPSGSSQWTIAYGSIDYADFINLTITDNPLRTSIEVYNDATHGGLYTTATAVNRGDVFEVSGTFLNFGSETTIGNCGIALVDNNDRILEVIGVDNFTRSFSYSSGYVLDIYCAVSSAITPGSYKIRAIFKPAGLDWAIVYGTSSSAIDILDLTVNSGTVPDGSNVFMYQTGFSADYTNPVNQFSPLTVNVRLANTGSTYFIGEIELGLYDSPGGTLQEVIETKNVSMQNGVYADYTFNSNSVNSPAGTYYMTLYQKGVDGVRKKVNPNGLPDYVSITVIGTSNTITWLGNSTNWTDPSNWDADRIPTVMDTVVIPSDVPNFPDLQSGDNASVAEIHFKPGAQLGHQSLLTYEKAFVQYNFSKRENWNMLSMPLGEAFPGDFVFGGYPLTKVRTFSTSTNGTTTKGGWNTAQGSTSPFTYGDGFVLYLDADSDPNDNMGLKKLDNTLELPYFENFDNTTANYGFYNEVDLAHDYSPGSDALDASVIGTSTFYNFSADATGTYKRINTDKYNVTRHENAFQLLSEKGTYTKPLNFGANNQAGGDIAIIGNPYMAALDFINFSSTNNTVINPCYHIWIGGVGAGYTDFSPEGTAGVIDESNSTTQWIAPLQSFLVEKASSASYTDESLQFSESMTAVNNNVALRSTGNNENKLNIDARDSIAGVRTFIAKRDGGQDEFGNLDVHKIINDISNVPEIYTLKPYQGSSVAASINIINDDELLIPIGLLTSYAGNITLSFSGMDSYGANLSLLDAETNKEINLTGLASYDYAVNYMPKIVNGTATACEDRFFIRISKIMTGLQETLAERVNVFEANGHIQVVSGASNPIKEVMVYNQQGAMIYKKSSINAISYTVDRNLPTGAYIVKVISEKNMDNVKVIVK